MTNCGPSGSESCCTSLEVAGGAYYRTYDPVNPLDGAVATAADGGPTGEADPATVSSFRLDKYEVTVGRFRQFVNAWSSGWAAPAGSGKHTHLNGGQGLASSARPGSYEPGWVTADNINVGPSDFALNACSAHVTWTPTPGANENLPITCANWWESYAFCIWDGGFLPSDAEWEYAAAGGTEQREYPWGTTAPGTASQYAIYGCYRNGMGPGNCEVGAGVTNLAPVGTATLGAGRWGHLDLAGNVAEWPLDWYTTFVDPCTDCADFTEAQYVVVRGGAFDSPTSADLLSGQRTYRQKNGVYFDIGFRCARSP